MNHDHGGTAMIGEMEIMWLLMVGMFIWNIVMEYQHRKLKRKVACRCEADEAKGK